MDDIKNDLRAPDAEEQVLGVADTSGYCNMSVENGIVEETYFNADCTKNEICFVDPQADYTFEISSSATDNMSCSVDPLSSGDSCENDKYLMRSYANLQTVEGGNSSWANILNPNEELSSNFELASSETSSDSFHSNTSEGSNSNLVPDESEDAMEILARTLNQSIDLEKPIICDVDESLDMSDTGSLDETIIDGKYISDTEDAKLSEISYALIKKHAVNIEKGLIIEYDESSETSISPLVIETTYVDQSSIIEPSELPKISDTPLMNRSIDVEIPKITDYNESIKRSDSSVLNQTINVDRPIITEDDTPPETLNALALHRTINVENSLITEYDESAEISVAPVGVGKRLVDYDESLENSDISLVNETINVENAVDTEYGKLPEISDALPRNQIINVENPRISEFNDKSDISNAPLAKTAITISNKSTEQTSAFLLNRIVNVEKPIIADDAFFQSQKVNVENKLVAEHDELHPKTDTSSLNQTINFEKLAIREDDKVTEISDALLSPPMINVEQSITTGKYESPEKPAAPLINQTTSDGNISITRYSDSPEKSGTTDLNQTITMDKRIIRDKGEGVKISDWLHGNQTINAEKFLIPETDESPEKRDSCFMNKTVRAENISISMYSPAPTDLNQTITMDKPEIRKDDKVVEISDGSLGNNRINVEKCILPEKAESPEKREARFMNQTLRVENISGTTYSDSPEKPVTTDLNQTITIDQPIIREDGEVVEISDGLLGNHRINAEKFIIPEKDESPEKRDSSFLHKTVHAENISISTYSPATTDLNQTITMDKPVIREDSKVVDISDGSLRGHRINVEKCILPEKAESAEKREARFMNQTLRVENSSLTTYSDSPEKSDTTDLNQTITMDRPIIREDGEVLEISDGLHGNQTINAENFIIPEKRDSSFMHKTVRAENISISAYSPATTDLNQTITMDKRVIREDGKVVDISDGPLGGHRINAEKCILPEKAESPENRESRFMNQTLRVENISLATYSDSPEKSDTTDLNQTITMDKPVIREDSKVVDISDGSLRGHRINADKCILPEKAESPKNRESRFMNQTLRVENISLTTYSDSPEKSDTTDLNQTITMDKRIIRDDGEVVEISHGLHGNQTIDAQKFIISENDESPEKRDARLMNQTIHVENSSVTTHSDSPEISDPTDLNQTITMDRPIIIGDGKVTEISDELVGNKTINVEKRLTHEKEESPGKRDATVMNQTQHVENFSVTTCNDSPEKSVSTPLNQKKKDISESFLGTEMKNVEESMTAEKDESSKKTSAPLINQTIGVQDPLVNNYKDLPEKLTTTLQSETIDAAKRIITEYDIISETSNVFVNKPIEKSAAPLIKSSIDAGKSLSPLRQSVVVENPVNTKCNGLSETADKTSDAHLINQTLNVMKRIITEHEASSKISGVPLRLEVVHKKVNDLLLGNKDASQINSKNIVEQLTKKFNELTKQTDMLVINADKIRKNIAQADQTILVNVLDVEAKVGKLKKCQNISEQYQLLVSSQNRKVALTIHASKEMEKPLTDAQARLASAMQRYGKAQALIESLKQNEEITKSNIKNIETQLSNIREKCQRIEDQFESNKKSQNRLSQEKENYQNDIAKQQAMIKRLKIKTLSMEALIEQKSQECKSIATLCEDITRKHQLETTRKCNENLDNV
ncbi:hypothetical protein HUJ04_004767 [Dendroctonus ponderosae]|uniref:Transforming acidic coiled-coil-containing protein C-terminal domain-containing protein n=1 Tax=Dendroctonus ponderosae TaxID=77166 RepID=A0AAR5PTV8_DENPD|nr:hypothetical protein HUJ04_004767 [Dendroctonus ponderosae]